MKEQEIAKNCKALGIKTGLKINKISSQVK